MLKELIHDKLNEVFLEYQNAHHIASGDIMPTDALELDRLEGEFENLVRRVCAYQPRETATSFYTYTDDEGNTKTVTYEDTFVDKFFTEVSKRIAFGDCTEETVTEIYWQGKKIEYAGWQSNMIFEYKDVNGNTVWIADFPEWDH